MRRSESTWKSPTGTASASRSTSSSADISSEMSTISLTTHLCSGCISRLWLVTSSHTHDPSLRWWRRRTRRPGPGAASICIQLSIASAWSSGWMISSERRPSSSCALQPRMRVIASSALTIMLRGSLHSVAKRGVTSGISSGGGCSSAEPPDANTLNVTITPWISRRSSPYVSSVTSGWAAGCTGHLAAPCLSTRSQPASAALSVTIRSGPERASSTRLRCSATDSGIATMTASSRKAHTGASGNALTSDCSAASSTSASRCSSCSRSNTSPSASAAGGAGEGAWAGPWLIAPGSTAVDDTETVVYSYDCMVGAIAPNLERCNGRLDDGIGA
jgi:hypothetical protein